MCTFKQHYNELTRKKKYAAKETIFSTLSLIFVKITPSKVNGYEMIYSRLKNDPVVSLYENHLKLHASFIVHCEIFIKLHSGSSSGYLL